MSVKGRQYPKAQAGAPLVVFDFDHTLYDGDSGGHLFTWLIVSFAAGGGACSRC
jgi:phosphatidylglycerophosphatase C